MFDGTNLEQDSSFELFSDDSWENSETQKSQIKVLQNNRLKKKKVHTLKKMIMVVKKMMMKKDMIQNIKVFFI